MKVWDVETATEAATFPQYTLVQGVALSPDGNSIALLVGGWLRIFHIRTRGQIRAIELPGLFNRIVFTPDGKGIIGCSDDRIVMMWHALSGQVMHTLRGHTATVSCLAVSPDSKHIASGGFDRTVKVWNVAAGQESYRTGFAGRVRRDEPGSDAPAVHASRLQPGR